MKEYKYIKRINWPWVEVTDGFSDGVSDSETSVVINMNDVSTIWSRSNPMYHYGVKYKDGGWFEFISQDALIELQDVVMKHV